MIEKFRAAGGRAYALSFYAITIIAVLEACYLGLVTYLSVMTALVLTPELISPLVMGVIAVSALGGAQTIPNSIERIGKGKAPPQLSGDS